MAKQILHQDRVLLAEVPEDGKDFWITLTNELAWFKNNLPAYYNGNTINLPKGQWGILGIASELKDEDWKKVINKIEEDWAYECYDKSNFRCANPTESGLSLLSHHQLTPNQTLVLIKK